MQATGFFNSLFDYSFSSFITPRIIKVLYVLMTIAVALWTLVLLLIAFKASAAAGILTLLIVGPIFFLISMIYVRVGLELLIVFFRIHGDVAEINVRGGGGDIPPASAPAPKAPAPAPADTGGSALDPAPAVSTSFASEPASSSQPAARFCDNCGAERAAGKRFCPACGAAFA